MSTRGGRPARAWARVAFSFALAGATLPIGACNGRAERSLRDSEGRTFSARCKTDGSCEIQQKSGRKRAEKPAQTLAMSGRLVGLCDVEPGMPPEGPFDCRPLRCESDQDCPPAHGESDGHCLNRWCYDPSGEIGVQDSILLCLAGTGLGRTSPQQIERYALALNCGTPCRVPAPCAQL